MIDVPAWFFLGVWFVSQFFIGAGSGVAWMAHVGGFLAGLGAGGFSRASASGSRSTPSNLPPGRW